MQPPILDDRTITVEGKEYRAKPVMLMYYYLQESFDLGEQQPAVKVHQALKAGMRFYHSDEEIMELMGYLTLPEVMTFLTGPMTVDMDTENEESNFTERPVDEFDDSYLTSGKMRGDGE